MYIPGLSKYKLFCLVCMHYLAANSTHKGHIYTDMFAQTHTDTRKQTPKMCTQPNICTFECMYVCVRVYVSSYVCTHDYIHMRIDFHKCMCMYPRVADMCTDIFTDIHKQMYIYPVVANTYISLMNRSTEIYIYIYIYPGVADVVGGAWLQRGTGPFEGLWYLCRYAHLSGCHKYIYKDICMYEFMFVSIYIYICECMYTYKYIVYMKKFHVCIFKCIQAYVCTCIQIYIYIYIYIYTCI